MSCSKDHISGHTVHRQLALGIIALCNITSKHVARKGIVVWLIVLSLTKTITIDKEGDDALIVVGGV
jgi:hypothetical protein